MGTWGSDIFDDDLALTIREEYFYLIENLDADKSVEIIKESFKEELNDSEEQNIVWLSLAAAQIENNTLTNIVKEKALDIIDNNKDLIRWEDEEVLLEERKAILKNLKENLIK